LSAWCLVTGAKVLAKRARKLKGSVQAGKVRSYTKSAASAGGQTRVVHKKKSKKQSEAENKTLETIATDKAKRTQMAKKWLEDEAYSKTLEVCNGLMGAIEAELILLVVPQRVVRPKADGETKYNCCMMGHVALPAAIIRNYLEKEAGTRSLRR